MPEPEPRTPLDEWRLKNKKTFVDISAACSAAGFGTSPDYVRQIVKGYYRPGYDLAAFLSGYTSGDVTVLQIMGGAEPRKGAA